MRDTDYFILDFDGTIADTLDMALAVYNTIAPEHNFMPAGAEDVELFRTKNPHELLGIYGISKLKLLTLTLRIKKEMARHIPEMKLFDGMDTAIKEIRNSGCRIGILTSNSAENVRACLAVNHLDGLIDFIYSGRSIFGKEKLIRKMLLREQIGTGRVVYAGDETRDIEACKATGIPIIAVSWGLNRKELLASHSPFIIADTPAELPSYVSKAFKMIKGL